MAIRMGAAMAVVLSATALGVMEAQAQATAALRGVRLPAESSSVALSVPDARTQALVKEAYAGVVGSVVCIRAVVERELSGVVAKTGMMGTTRSSLALHGTGVVVDSTVENGRTEYLVLTNDHVANPTLYFDVHGDYLTELKRGGTSAPPGVAEKRYIVDSSNDEDASDDVELTVVARAPGGDVALLKTVHASRPLTVFHGPIGFGGGGVKLGSLVITSGYPYGDRLNTAFGRVLDERYQHSLGAPHTDYALDTPLEPGQSGSPVFLVGIGRGATPEVRFTLIGLLHAREAGAHLMLPFPLWSGMLRQLPSQSASPTALP